MAIKLLLWAPGGGTDSFAFRAVTALPLLAFLQEESFDITYSAREYVAGRYSYKSGGARGGGGGRWAGGEGKGRCGGNAGGRAQG